MVDDGKKKRIEVLLGEVFLKQGLDWEVLDIFAPQLSSGELRVVFLNRPDIALPPSPTREQIRDAVMLQWCVEQEDGLAGVQAKIGHYDSDRTVYKVSFHWGSVAFHDDEVSQEALDDWIDGGQITPSMGAVLKRVKAAAAGASAPAE